LIRGGHSNAAIASLRGRSITTINNQVAAILRKTGVPHRRGLLVMASPSDRSRDRDWSR
jgi:DNA-binding CsgD family transcriptional regulator